MGLKAAAFAFVAGAGVTATLTFERELEGAFVYTGMPTVETASNNTDKWISIMKKSADDESANGIYGTFNGYQSAFADLSLGDCFEARVHALPLEVYAVDGVGTYFVTDTDKVPCPE